MISFRDTTEADALMVAEWIEADEDHKGRIKPEFFTKAQDKVILYVIEDDKGPVIFVRQEADGTNTRLHTEFLPGGKLRIARALKEAYPAVAKQSKEWGFHQVFFESKSIPLVAFMVKHFGFVADCKVQL